MKELPPPRRQPEDESGSRTTSTPSQTTYTAHRHRPHDGGAAAARTRKKYSRIGTTRGPGREKQGVGGQAGLTTVLPITPAAVSELAIPDQFALGAPQVKSCGGPVMAHNTNTKIFLKRAGRGRKKAVLQHSPFMPYGDCEFSITAAGVVDAVDG